MWKDGRNPKRRCTAKRSDGSGEQCRRVAILEGRCARPTGSTRHIKAKARQRLEDAADRMARELLGIATDKNAPESVRLAAIRDALDRAGVSARTAVSVEVGRRPYEVVFDDITSESRAESRARRGVPDDEPNGWPRTALVGPVDAEPSTPRADEVVDCELVESGTQRTNLMPGSNAELTANGGRRLYTIDDFGRSR